MEALWHLKKASLACAVCGSRNYSIKISGNPKTNTLRSK
ncbi:conserved domain protein [Streptococcus infantis SK1302]|uniref:Conserved domain protein n=1 Tax=Streptococcus infantis SK1302 TaxID=871237 RepID=A0ABP2JC88_9STRE|nr:conserved domain protein [Streptococcus infantis SK1302]